MYVCVCGICHVHRQTFEKLFTLLWTYFHFTMSFHNLHITSVINNIATSSLHCYYYIQYPFALYIEGTLICFEMVTQLSQFKQNFAFPFWILCTLQIYCNKKERKCLMYKDCPDLELLFRAATDIHSSIFYSLMWFTEMCLCTVSKLSFIKFWFRGIWNLELLNRLWWCQVIKNC